MINVLGNSRILFGGNFGSKTWDVTIPIGSMYGIYANIWGILMVNVTIYSIHGSYGIIYGSFFKEKIRSSTSGRNGAANFQIPFDGNLSCVITFCWKRFSNNNDV